MQILRGEPGVVPAAQAQLTDDQTHIVLGANAGIRSPEPEAFGKLRHECFGPGGEFGCGGDGHRHVRRGSVGGLHVPRIHARPADVSRTA